MLLEIERTGQIVDGFRPFRGVTGLACLWQLALPSHLKCWCLWLERSWCLPKVQSHSSSLPHCASGRAMLLRAHQVCSECLPTTRHLLGDEFCTWLTGVRSAVPALPARLGRSHPTWAAHRLRTLAACSHLCHIYNLHNPSEPNYKPPARKRSSAPFTLQTVK